MTQAGKPETDGLEIDRLIILPLLVAAAEVVAATVAAFWLW